MVSKSGPGKSYRKGISLLDAVKKFDTEEKAEAWFVSQTLARWRSLSLLWQPECRHRRQPQAPALPVPREDLPQVLLREDGNATP